MRTGLLVGCAALVVACGPSADSYVDGGQSSGTIDAAAPEACSGDERRCVGTLHQTCVGGQFETQADCAATNGVCDPDLGCVACDPDFGNVCVGDDVHACTDNGTVGPLVTECGLEACEGGVCVDACGEAASQHSYIGCTYWPVDLHNAVEVVAEPFLGDCSIYGVPGLLPRTVDVCYNDADILAPLAGLCDPESDCSGSPGYACQSREVCMLDAQGSPYAIVVSNPHATRDATVTIENMAGAMSTISVGPGQVAQIFPQQVGFPDQSVPGSGQAPLAYKLTSNRPIVAYQFNPLDNVDVFSNDGSLLLPEHTYDTRYYVVTHPSLARRPTAQDFPGYVSVVAHGPTTLTVTPTAAVRPGGGVPASPAGMARTFTLDEWDVLTLEAAGSGDLTGTVIESDGATFGAYAGHVATAPSTNAQPCCADHLEDQLFPTSTWGKSYAVARSLPRGSEPDMVRIIAQRPSTAVTLAPAVGTCPVLGPGEFCEVNISGDVEITATEPVMVAHYLLAVGNAGSGANPQGDPALAFAVPSEQFRTSYTLLVPAQYASNYFAIVVPAGGTATLDGADVTGQLAGFGSGAFAAGRVAVGQGAHTLVCSLGCGVEVGGYDEAVSYLFAGGLDLEPIVVD